MKPENKLPVLELISAEIKAVVNTIQPDLPLWPTTGTLLSNDSITRLSADSGMLALQKWQPAASSGSNTLWSVQLASLAQKSTAQATLFIFMAAAFSRQS
ncbi:hypothetical protein ACNKHR_04935 [Shigella flexneri]